MARARAAGLLSALDAYLHEMRLFQHSAQILSYRPGADLFAKVHELASALPLSHSAWIEVLISRFEFVQALWDAREPSRSPSDLADCHARHLAAIQKLRRLCLQMQQSPDA